MTKDEILYELSLIGNERMKKRYLNEGVREPVFGVAIKDLKPLAKKLKNNQQCAMELYNSGNYDAMYLAGMICDPNIMTEDDFEDWISKAYCYYIADYTVAIVLADSDLALKIADKWINSDDEIRKSAGFYTYTWVLGIKKDDFFDSNAIAKLMNYVQENINDMPDRVKVAMNDFIVAVGISYLPLHDKAKEVAKNIEDVKLIQKGKIWKSASKAINNEVGKGRLGFKRKSTRC